MNSWSDVEQHSGKQIVVLDLNVVTLQQWTFLARLQ